MQIDKKFVLWTSVLVGLFLIVVIVAVILGRQEANKIEQEEIIKNEQGEEVRVVTKDSNIKTRLVDTTTGEGHYRNFIYEITNISSSPIKYSMKNDAYVDYKIYEKNEKGEYVEFYHYTKVHKPGQGVMYLEIPVEGVENRTFKLSKISPGDYKIEFWLNVDQTKRVNLEEAYFNIK